MSMSSPRAGCRWYARRLPLLAGGELAGSERRKVERHLIACGACRSRREALAGALGVLHAVAAEVPAGASDLSDAGSLWPALRQQIREERHAPRRPASGLGLDDWSDRLPGWLRLRPRGRVVSLAGLAAAAVVALVAAGGVERWAWWRAEGVIRAARRPADVPPSLLTVQPLPTSGPVLVWEPSHPASHPSSAAAAAPAATPDGSERVDYDLDAGTPMGPDARERTAKASY